MEQILRNHYKEVLIKGYEVDGKDFNQLHKQDIVNAISDYLHENFSDDEIDLEKEKSELSMSKQYLIDNYFKKRNTKKKNNNLVYTKTSYELDTWMIENDFTN